MYLFRGWGEGLATVPEEDPKEKKTKLQTMPHTKQAPSRGSEGSVKLKLVVNLLLCPVLAPIIATGPLRCVIKSDSQSLY